MSISYSTFLENIALIQTSRYGADIRRAIYENFEYLGNQLNKNVDLTSSEYNSLPEAKKLNGTTYFLTDTQEIYRKGIKYSGGTDNPVSDIEGVSEPNSINASVNIATLDEGE